FSPQRLRRYKRGEIIKVHLGFNVGSEEGGLHYAVVVEKNNPKSSPVVTIVPLTSVKPNTNIERLPSGDVFLGNELFTSLNAKISSTSKHIQDELKLINELGMNSESHIPENNMEEISARSNAAIKELRLLDRMRNEVRKMRIGSIALVNQITTVSKIRIRDPKTDHDILSNIKLSNEKLDILDAEIQRRYTNF
ncbi:MAG: type II toxin-antitoxin system PemK/MazF family toxin, partial [Lachnospiraceae bacterium]|nr:type II toxin-antitoxin system PemK/MazF family toxin [Lachnospiraceae bacterium]